MLRSRTSLAVALAAFKNTTTNAANASVLNGSGNYIKQISKGPVISMTPSLF